MQTKYKIIDGKVHKRVEGNGYQLISQTEFANEQKMSRQALSIRIKRGWQFGIISGKEVLYPKMKVVEIK